MTPDLCYTEHKLLRDIETWGDFNDCSWVSRLTCYDYNKTAEQWNIYALLEKQKNSNSIAAEVYTHNKYVLDVYSYT